LQTAFIRNADGAPETLAYLALAAWRLNRPDAALSYCEAALRVMQHQRFRLEELALAHFYRYHILLGIGREVDADAALRLAYQEVSQLLQSQVHDKVFL
jgi:hypothetical protein